MAEKAKGTKKKFQVPHILVIIGIIVLVACLRTYIAPVGEFDLDEAGNAIAGTYHAVERTTVSPWQALLMVKKGIENAASMISLMLIGGGSIACIVGTGAFDDILNYGVFKLSDRSVTVLVPSIVVLMGLLGSFAGTDSMIAFVTVGLVICKRLHLDRICAMGMFYLGYLVGMGATFTGMITMQLMAGVEPMSGMGVRMIIWAVFVGLNAWWCTRYAKKISADPSKSYCGGVMHPDEDMEEIKEAKFPIRGIIVVLVMFGIYGFYAVANNKWGWDQSYLVALQIILAYATGLIYHQDLNKISKNFFKGACDMGGISLVMGVARVIGFVLTQGHVMHTLANWAANIIGGSGLALAGAGLFIFTLIFNFLIPSRTSKMAIMFPVLIPIGDVCGLSRQVVALAYQYGDSISNTLTPMSGPLVGALGLADVSYDKWLKYSAPLMGIYAVISIAVVAFLASVGYVG